MQAMLVDMRERNQDLDIMEKPEWIYLGSIVQYPDTK